MHGGLYSQCWRELGGSAADRRLVRSLVYIHCGSCKCEEGACLGMEAVPRVSQQAPCLELRPSGLILATFFLAVCPRTSRCGSGTPSFLVLGPSRFVLGIKMYVWELWGLAGGNNPLSSAPHIREIPPHLLHPLLPELKLICLHLIFYVTDIIILIRILNLKLLLLLENSKAYISK